MSWEPNRNICIRAGDNHEIQWESGLGKQELTAAGEVGRLFVLLNAVDEPYLSHRKNYQ